MESVLEMLLKLGDGDRYPPRKRNSRSLCRSFPPPSRPHVTARHLAPSEGKYITIL